MRAVPVAEFKDKVSEFVSAAEGGEEIVITRHGKPAARLMPAIDEDDIFERQRRAIAQSLKTREMLRSQGVRVTAADVREWIDEGRA